MKIIDRDFTFENLRELVSIHGVEWTAMMICSDIFRGRGYDEEAVVEEIFSILGPELGS